MEESENLFYINSVSGRKLMKDFDEIEIILPHEHIIQNITRYLKDN